MHLFNLKIIGMLKMLSLKCTAEILTDIIYIFRQVYYLNIQILIKLTCLFQKWARVPLRTDDNRRKFNHSINNNMSRSRSPYRRERSTSPSNRGRSSPVYNNSSPSQSRLRSRSPRSPFHRRNSFSRSPVDN